MPAVSEDIPSGVDGDFLPSVRKSLQELGILGTKIMRWEKNADGSFVDPKEYPLTTMTSVSNHDIETLQIWWQKFPHEAEKYSALKKWTYFPLLSVEQRKAILQESHESPSLLHINPIQEYLACFPELIWEEPQDERINIPGTILPTNWSYRLKVNIEDLASHQGLKEVMHEIIP